MLAPSPAATGLSFLRHGNLSLRCTRGGSNRYGRLPPIIVTMSFNRLFLGGLLSSRARLRFAGFRYSATHFPVRKIGWDQHQPKEDTSNVVK